MRDWRDWKNFFWTRIKISEILDKSLLIHYIGGKKRLFFMGQIMLRQGAPIYYMLFGRPYEDIFSGTIHKDFIRGKDVIDCRTLNLKNYDGYEYNQHHFKTEYVYELVLPFMNNKMNFGFRKDDFNFKWIDTEVPNFRILRPIQNEFTFHLIVEDEDYGEGLGLDFLMNINEKTAPGITTYHKLYKGAHQCSRIINTTLHNEKNLLVTGDSHSIPIIPILACYYETVVFLDNRSGKSHQKLWEDTVFSDVLIQLSNENATNKYIKTNLL